MSKKPCSISFKPAGKNKPCTTVINGDLKVKKNIVAQCDLTVKKCLNVKNIVYSNTETITETGQTVSGVKSLSWINTNGQGELSDNTKDGFYKKVIKISEGSSTEGWTSVGNTGDINSLVYSICCNNQNDELYILTDSTDITGIIGLDYVAKWTGSGWTSLGATGQILWVDGNPPGEQDLCCDNEGNIYLSAGDLEFDVGFGNTYLAKWNETDGWTNVGGAGLTASVNSICCNSNDGNLYIGGGFENVDGVAVGMLAKYNDTDGWSSVGGLISGGPGAVYKVCCDSKDGSIYIGGSFTNLTTEGLWRLGKYNDIDGWTSVGQTSDISDKVYDICCDSENGDIYIAGDFNTVAGITDLNKVAKWDAKSQSWTSISGNTGDFGSGGQVAYSICCKNGEIYVGGQFTSVAGLGIEKLAKWTGSSWTSVGGLTDINNAVYDICCDTKNGEIYVGGGFSDVASLGINNLARFDQIQNYTLTYNTTDEVTLTNVGENACFIYNETLGEWVKI